MNQEAVLRELLLKSMAYTNGKWVGKIELAIRHQEADVLGDVSFMYDRTWHLQAFKYPHGLSDNEREAIKDAFTEQFKTFSSFLETHFFKKREEHGIRPKIMSFGIQEELSDNDSIYAQFTLHGIRDVFFITIQLINHVWQYKIHSKQQSIDRYKTFYTWEDAVFDCVIEEINKNTHYRLKFVVHAKQYKYK